MLVNISNSFDKPEITPEQEELKKLGEAVLWRRAVAADDAHVSPPLPLRRSRCPAPAFHVGKFAGESIPEPHKLDSDEFVKKRGAAPGFCANHAPGAYLPRFLTRPPYRLAPQFSGWWSENL